MVCFILAYLILGIKIVWTALKNISKGQVFDENFLMSIATIGAFGVGEFAEAVGVMMFYRIGELFEEKAVERSRSQIMDVIDMRPEVVNLVDDYGDVTVIDAEEAEIGDILLVRPGDRIPLDGIITDGETMIDTSPVTGEPIPVSASAGTDVTSGCLNTSGVIKIKVEKILEESMVTRIMDSVENAAASKPKMDRFITRFSRCIYSICRTSCPCNCDHSFFSDRKLDTLDIHSFNFPCNQLSLCPCIKCTSCILLWNRSWI